ncbi:MAG: dihydropteroate synthase [Phycisphaerae bacterium]|nr:dihydropteroate synthase [Phycisphaerae bacterium]
MIEANRKPYQITWPGGTLDLTGRPLVMGVLNVTPDSFSDGGEHFDHAVAVDRAAEMIRQGADLIDVGGESTRPGSEAVPPAEQIRRTQPVIAAVRQAFPDVPISIDARLAEVAAAALDAGAILINDVAALRDDAAMAPLAAERQVPVILMHMLGAPKTMQQDPRYDDVIADISTFLRERIDAAVAAGIDRRRIIVDPGIGFGKTVRHNLEIVKRWHELAALDAPTLVGPSRKRFIGSVLGIDDAHDRVLGTAAVVAAATLAGAHIVRVHDVRQAADVTRMCHAIAHPDLHA